jgi:hypothetical protein
MIHSAMNMFRTQADAMSTSRQRKVGVPAINDTGNGMSTLGAGALSQRVGADHPGAVSGDAASKDGANRHPVSARSDAGLSCRADLDLAYAATRSAR